MLKNMIIKEKIKDIYTSFYSPDYPSQFFFKSMLHHVISLEIYKSNYESGISFEMICSIIPNSIGSRSSIQSILNDALRKNIFIKKQSNDDKRVKKFYLSDNYLKIINTWIKKEEFYFTNFNGG
tara:strand:+ start:107 stop:478 length:372 start_codon:yes stop_codon:yes gene_type:complete